MSRKLTPSSTLGNLKREAKRWLLALRGNSEEARARFERALPGAPAVPSLRHVQHALAREHGLPGWMDLKTRVMETAGGESHAELVDAFLLNACADPLLANGPARHARRARAALRMLTRHPEIGRDNIHTAAVCGDLEEVERLLAGRPAAAREPGGPQRRRYLPEREKLWTPLLHLCYGRLPTAAAGDNAVAIARLLLDRGADPNDFFEVGSPPNRYTALCGVAGEGEDDAPPHPRREELARLLLERGAEPYDIQVFYNTHFHGDILWLLELVYEYSVKAGRQPDWDGPEWSMIGMGRYGYGARYFLGQAIAKRNVELVEWLLAHGASPNAAPPPHPKASKRPLHEEALRLGFMEIADLLVRFGAEPAAYTPSGLELFTAACFRLDAAEARAMLDGHPEYVLSPVPMFAAAKRDRADVVELLLDLGMPIEIEDAQKQRALHVAAGHGSLNVAMLLVERGAEIDPVESNWDNTPLGAALYGQQTPMVAYLSGLSRDPWLVTYAGNLGRLRELLAAEPDLAKATKLGGTILMWLPDDEPRAIELADLLIAHGADPSVKDAEGLTPAAYARRRGLYELAERLK